MTIQAVSLSNVAIGQLLKIKYGKSLTSANRVSTGSVAVYGSGGLAGYHNASLTRGETLIIGRKGSIGAVYHSTSECWPIDTTYFIDEFPKILYPKYVYWFFKSLNLKHLDKSAAIPGINRDDLYPIEIPLPFPDDSALSLRVQRAIVARIESLLSELREIHDLHATIDRDVDEVMESVLEDVFNVHSTQGWNEKGLGQLVEINARLVDPQAHEYRDLPHIHGGVISEVTCQLLPYRSAREDEVTSGKYHFNPGSIIYSKIRPKLRKVALVDFEGLCSADAYPLEVKNNQKLDAKFLQWTLVSPGFTQYVIELSGRARIPKVNQDQLFSYPMRYPSIHQQRQIAAYLEATRDEVTEMQRIQTDDQSLLEQVEQSILAQAFRGEL